MDWGHNMVYGMAWLAYGMALRVMGNGMVYSMTCGAWHCS